MRRDMDSCWREGAGMNDRICSCCGGSSEIRCKWINGDGEVARRLRCLNCRSTWTVVGDFTNFQFYGRRPVECIDTGEVYPSLASAAKAIWVTRSTMSAAVRLGFRAARKRWRYVEASS